MQSEGRRAYARQESRQSVGCHHCRLRRGARKRTQRSPRARDDVEAAVLGCRVGREGCRR